MAGGDDVSGDHERCAAMRTGCGIADILRTGWIVTPEPELLLSPTPSCYILVQNPEAQHALAPGHSPGPHGGFSPRPAALIGPRAMPSSPPFPFSPSPAPAAPLPSPPPLLLPGPSHLHAHATPSRSPLSGRALAGSLSPTGMRSVSPVPGPSSLPASLGASPLTTPPVPASSPAPPFATLPSSALPLPAQQQQQQPQQPSQAQALQVPGQPQTQSSTPTSSSSSSLSSPLTQLPQLSSFFDLPARPPSSSGSSARRRHSLRPGFWIPQSSLLRNESKDASLPGSGAVTPALAGEAGKIRDPAAMSVSSDSRAGSEWGGDAGDADAFGEECADTEGEMSLDEHERERGEGEDATLRVSARRAEDSKLEEIFGDAKMSPELGPARPTARLPYLTRVTRLLTLETSPMPEIESEAALQRLMGSSPIPPTPLSSAFRKAARGGHNRYPESAVLDESSESDSSDDERAGGGALGGAGVPQGKPFSVGAMSTGSNSLGLGQPAPMSSGSASTAASERENRGIPIPDRDRDRDRDVESDFADDVSMSEGSLWGMRGSPVMERSLGNNGSGWGRAMDLDVPPALPSPYRSTPPPSYARKRKRSLSPSTPSSTFTNPSTSAPNSTSTSAAQAIPIKRPRLSHLSTPTGASAASSSIAPLTPHALLPPFLPSSPTSSLPGGPSPRPGMGSMGGMAGVGVANASPRWARAGLGAGTGGAGGYGYGLGILSNGGGAGQGAKEPVGEAGEGVRKMSLQE
ncbi:hypothetical protein CALCODRAFT_530657 [Calocera cornea HHB12733]|uniref:Uncharacterized protein n=1 Tax=Calocera cornea HHB12733 TaxID=1353952 RepID=A0A165DEV5_9BASI|nr:hypothetical protein CALCODRAFT_530657 [Calocera cornea HHB12733]